MSPDETEETRKHVRLESIHGSVNATVNIVPVLRGEKCKIRMFMRSSHGGVFARIVSHYFCDSTVETDTYACKSEWPRVTPSFSTGSPFYLWQCHFTLASIV